MARGKPDFVDGVRTNRTGRRTYAEGFKRLVIRQCNEPGISLASVAMAHRINANLVRRWVRHQQKPPPKSEAATLLPVTVEADGTVAGDIGKRANSNAGTIEIEVYGARIRLRGGVDVASLRSVLDVLARR